MFTPEELNTFSKEGLKRLCGYFKIKIVGNKSKAKMIEGIVAYLKEHEETDENAPKMSPMVKRIHDRMKEK